MIRYVTFQLINVNFFGKEHSILPDMQDALEISLIHTTRDWMGSKPHGPQKNTVVIVSYLLLLGLTCPKLALC